MPVPLAVVLSQCITKAAVAAGCFAKFHGELSEQVLLLEVATSLGNLPTQDFGECEVLQQGDEMGRFLLGSTVVLLWPRQNVRLNPQWQPGAPVRLGEAMAQRFTPS